MPSHKARYVNIYRAGLSGQSFSSTYSYKRSQAEAVKERKGYSKCSGCGNRYKNPLALHYADFKNKIRCLNRGIENE